MFEAAPQRADAEREGHAQPPGQVHLRLWPAIFVVLGHVAVTGWFAVLDATNAGTVIGMAVVPLLALLLLVIWWLAFSRAPRWDRILGVLLFSAACAGVVLCQKNNGLPLLMFAIPAMTIGLAVLLAATVRVRWPVRRWLCAGLLLFVVGASAFMRVDGFTGSMVPILAFRWSAAEGERASALPAIEAHGTANLPAQFGPEDWPGFRGEKRDGRLRGVRFSTDWSKPPRELWRKQIGQGWGSFAAVGDYVFTQEQRGNDELVTCCRADTGEDVWVNRMEARHDDGNGPGPRATPTFDRGRLYTQGATGILQCVDAATGATLWKQDLAKDPDSKQIVFGFSSSPLVAGERLFVFAGGGDGKNVAALDCNTGAVIWMSGWKTAGYSSPQIASIAGVPQLVMISDAGVQSFDVDSGRLLWDHFWKIKMDSRIVQPLVIDIDARTAPEDGQSGAAPSGDGVLVGSTGIMGTRLLRIKKTDAAWGVEAVYTAKKFRPYFNDFVLHKGHCYGFDGSKLACMDPANGAVLWESGRCGGQLLLVADMDALLVLNEEGEVLLVRAAPEAYKELARFKAIEGKTWNHPVIARGRLFVRNAEEAACFQLD